jgi:hypothetical protein
MPIPDDPALMVEPVRHYIETKAREWFGATREALQAEDVDETTAESTTTPKGAPRTIRLRRRSPEEVAAYFDAKREELKAAGKDTALIDTVAKVMAEYAAGDRAISPGHEQPPGEPYSYNPVCGCYLCSSRGWTP